MMQCRFCKTSFEEEKDRFKCPVCGVVIEWAFNILLDRSADGMITHTSVNAYVLSNKFTVELINPYRDPMLFVYADYSYMDAVYLINQKIEYDDGTKEELDGVKLEYKNGDSVTLLAFPTEEIRNDFYKAAKQQVEKKRNSAHSSPVRYDDLGNKISPQSSPSSVSPKPSPEIISPAVSEPKRIVKQCPKCRLRFGQDKDICPICGGSLEIKS